MYDFFSFLNLILNNFMIYCVDHREPKLKVLQQFYDIPINKDYNIVNALSICLVMLILLITFKSFLLPILLIIVIEGGIFINMSRPYYTGKSMMFLGYLIVSSIELGATIDYAILMTNNYLDARKENDKQAEVFYLIINNTVETKWFSTAHQNQPYITIDEEGLNDVLAGKEPKPYVKKIKDFTFRY